MELIFLSGLRLNRSVAGAGVERALQIEGEVEGFRRMPKQSGACQLRERARVGLVVECKSTTNVSESMIGGGS